MGYELYITRAAYFYETREAPIQESEWLAVVEADSTLLQSFSDWLIRIGPDGYEERVHPWLYVEHPDQPTLWYLDGAISTKNPDEKLISKLVELARALDARVIGEEGEVYTD